MTDMKGPESYGMWTYVWVIGLALWGGVAGFMSKLKSGRARAFNVTEFIGELAISGLVGVLTFFFCEWAGFNQLFTAAAVGITGHMGSRGIMLLERLMIKQLPGATQNDSKTDH